MSTFALKMIAVVLMVIDHVGYYFEAAPVWFRWIGRACYPLFLFCMVWGYHHTKSRIRYLLRLYAMSVLMTLFGYALDTYVAAKHDYGNHNIFLSMFLVGVVISTIELFQQDRRKGALMLGGIFAVQALYYILPWVLPYMQNISGDTLTDIIPNLAINEYGPTFIALGAAMYFIREQKDLFCAVYLLFCITQFSMELLEYGAASQWLMVAALPLMMRYNGEKGPGMKWFFYIFYPAHTFLLFYLANYVIG